MKTLKFKFVVIVILFFSSSWICAQTYQFEWTYTWNHETVFCLNHKISGTNTYHMMYHLNPKTKVLEFAHANIIDSDLLDEDTGEKLILIDVGSDSYGPMWGFVWSSSGGAFDLPDTWTSEGTNIWANFKLISKGGTKVSIHENWQLHLNADGDPKVNFIKASWDCN